MFHHPPPQKAFRGRGRGGELRGQDKECWQRLAGARALGRRAAAAPRGPRMPKAAVDGAPLRDRILLQSLPKTAMGAKAAA